MTEKEEQLGWVPITETIRIRLTPPWHNETPGMWLVAYVEGDNVVHSFIWQQPNGFGLFDYASEHHKGTLPVNFLATAKQEIHRLEAMRPTS